MVSFYVDLGPEQIPITKERIQKMITLHPRRMQLVREWQTALYPPDDNYPNWRILLPFCETLRNTFCSMCPSIYYNFKEVKNERCFTFLNDAKEDEEILNKVKTWLSVIGKYVAVRDCLAISFAIDYDREGGNPLKARTGIGILRRRAKPYDGQPTTNTYEAADQLIKACLEFIDNVDCYKHIDVVAAVPPSDPTKSFSLPAHIASGIASAINIPNLTSRIKTISSRSGLKEVPLENKLCTLEGTTEVDQNAFKGKTVLLIDDLYQSGVSINYAGMLLLEAGAKKIFGLACEKTCSNDDNVSRRGT